MLLSGAVKKALNVLNFLWSNVYSIIIFYLFLLDLAEQKKQKVSEIKAGIDEAEALVLSFYPHLESGHFSSCTL